jgi:hypothetical protein
MVLLLVIAISIIVTLTYTISWVKFQQFQFLERDYSKVAKHPEYSKGWHFWKAVNQLLFFSIMFFLVGPRIAAMDMIIYWILFDGIFNKTVLKREFFYIGTTAQTDISFRKLAHLINIPFKQKLSPFAVSGFVKIALLITSIILIF